jgi:hypothetical protein
LVRGFVTTNKEEFPIDKLISLDKAKIPAIAISVFLLVFGHVACAIRAARQTNVDFSLYVTDILYSVVAIGATVFFLFNGIRLMVYLVRLDDGSNGSLTLLRKVRAL